jgi:hypothetical protein
MSNRLNYSSLDDAWKLSDNKKFNYQKPKENIMTIDSNEIKQPIKKKFNPVVETYQGYLKPCDLIDEHLKNCEICRNKFQNKSSSKVSKNYLETIENFNTADLYENFENISPSQKNLLVIILYGILIILISDLIIKESND